MLEHKDVRFVPRPMAGDPACRRKPAVVKVPPLAKLDSPASFGSVVTDAESQPVPPPETQSLFQVAKLTLGAQHPNAWLPVPLTLPP